MPLINQLSELIDELSSKTSTGGLKWHEPAAGGKFTSIVDRTKMQIWKWQRPCTDDEEGSHGESVISFEMFDSYGHEIVSTDIGEDEPHFNRLETLHDVALFNARDVGAVVANLRARLKGPKLVVKKARYGVPNGKSKDVTEKVAELVSGDTLNVVATNDLFGDPEIGQPKRLTVDYTLDGKPESKFVAEQEMLVIP
jgi:hypothetical protein